MAKTNELAHRFFSRLKDDHFSLAYMGAITDELTDSLMRSNESSIDESRKFKKKLGFLIAECFQNIIRHADKPEVPNRTTSKPEIFILRNRANEHTISSTNLIATERIDELKSKLKMVNSLTEEELKMAYLHSLENNELSEKGGGGLGLIEMARKSGAPLEFDFEPINYYYSIFYFQVVFRSRDLHDSPKQPVTTKQLPVSDTQSIYHTMMDEQIILLRKGSFSQEVVLPLIDLIEGNLKLQKDISMSRSTAIYLLVELLQNISKHGKAMTEEKEGIFQIAVKDGHYVFTTGNYIDTMKAAELKQKLDTISKLDKKQLLELYAQTLRSDRAEDSRNAGIGLIEMCKYSKSPIEYSFYPVDETTQLYYLSVTM